MRYHPRVGHVYVPNARVRVAGRGGPGYLVRVNGDGFRSEREFLDERTADSRRVLLFGDSQSAGSGLSNRYRFSDLVESATPGIEIDNYSVSGTGTDQHRLIYEEYRHRDHDLIVICLYVENIRRVVSRVIRSAVDGDDCYTAKPYYELVDDELVLRHVPVPKHEWSLDTLPAELRDYAYPPTGWAPRLTVGPLAPVQRTLKSTAMRVDRLRPFDEYDSADHPDWRLLRRILEAWIRSSSTPVVLLTLPHYFFLADPGRATGYRTRFAELAADTGCHLCDPLDTLLALPGSERRHLWRDSVGHLSTAGHGVMAGILAPVIRSLV